MSSRPEWYVYAWHLHASLAPVNAMAVHPWVGGLCVTRYKREVGDPGTPVH